VINIQSTLRTNADCVKMFHSAVLFGSNGNSYIISKQSDTLQYTETLVEQRNFKNWDNRECPVP